MRVRTSRSEFDTSVTDTAGNDHDITVVYSGYSDPGKLYGPPENCYPAEGEIVIHEIKGLPEGVKIDVDEEARIEELAWEDLFQPREA